METLAAFLLPNLGGTEMLIIGIVLLLLFGRRLPEVGRSLGQGIVQFKKGLRDIGDEIDEQSKKPDPPKFESVRTPSSSEQRVPQGEQTHSEHPA